MASLPDECDEEASHSQDLDSLGRQELHQVPVGFEVVVARHKRLRSTVPWGLDHDVVIRISTRLNLARDGHDLTRSRRSPTSSAASNSPLV